MSRIDTKARIAAIRTEIAEQGHHPGPDSLVNQDLLALCDEVERLMAAMRAFVTAYDMPAEVAAYNELMRLVDVDPESAP